MLCVARRCAEDCRRVRPNAPVNPHEQAIVDDVRMNVVFEQAILAGLAGAAVGGALRTLLETGVAISQSTPLFGIIVGFFLTLLQSSFLIFLGAFISAVAVVTPLFVALERMKLRQTWPFFVAAFAVVSLYLGLSKSRIDFFFALEWRDVVTVIAPAILITWLFTQRLRPLWRAAATREERAPASNVHRLH